MSIHEFHSRLRKVEDLMTVSNEGVADCYREVVMNPYIRIDLMLSKEKPKTPYKYKVVRVYAKNEDGLNKVEKLLNKGYSILRVDSVEAYDVRGCKYTANDYILIKN